MKKKEISEQLEALSDGLLAAAKDGISETLANVDPDYKAVLSGFLMGLQAAKAFVDGVVTLSDPKKSAESYAMVCCLTHIASEAAADRELAEEKESTDEA